MVLPVSTGNWNGRSQLKLSGRYTQNPRQGHDECNGDISPITI